MKDARGHGSNARDAATRGGEAMHQSLVNEIGRPKMVGYAARSAVAKFLKSESGEGSSAMSEELAQRVMEDPNHVAHLAAHLLGYVSGES